MIVDVDLDKQSSEVWRWGVDFSAELGVGETISTAVFRAIKLSDATDATIAIQQGSTAIDGGLVTQTIQGGIHGEVYLLELRVTTSIPHTWEAERRLIVRDIPFPRPLGGAVTLTLTAMGALD